jgi:hypothetical protein
MKILFSYENKDGVPVSIVFEYNNCESLLKDFEVTLRSAGKLFADNGMRELKEWMAKRPKQTEPIEEYENLDKTWCENNPLPPMASRMFTFMNHEFSLSDFIKNRTLHLPKVKEFNEEF